MAVTYQYKSPSEWLAYFAGGTSDSEKIILDIYATMATGTPEYRTSAGWKAYFDATPGVSDNEKLLVDLLAQTEANAGSGSIVTATLEAFQAALDGGTLVFPATYKINDIEAGLYVQTVSGSSYNPLCQLQMYTPDYTITGDYKGQLASTDSVAIGDKWIWGNQVWESITGVNSPAIDNQTLDATDWTLLAKAEANGYILSTFTAGFDGAAGIVTSLAQARELNSAAVPSILVGQFGPAINNNQWANSSLNYLQSTGIGSANNRIIGGFVFDNDKLTLVENEVTVGGVIGKNQKLGGTGVYRRNVVTNAGQIVDNNLLVNGLFENNTVDSGKLSAIYCHNSIIQGCTISGDSDNSIGYGHQKDASEVTNVSLTGVHCVLEAFLQNNNSKIIGLAFSGNNNTLTGLSQLLLDEITNMTLSGDQIFIGALTQNGNSKLDNVTISAVGGSVNIRNIQQSLSTIKNVTYTLPLDITIENLEVNRCTLEGINNIRLLNCLFDGCDTDLAGFTSDITNLEIRGKKGNFSFSNDFAVNTLASGNTINFGFLPAGAVVTSLMFVTEGLTGPGASLALGIPVDDATYGFAATAIGALANSSKLVLSNKTTAKRAFALAASGGNVTAGKISVTVEFTIL